MESCITAKEKFSTTLKDSEKSISNGLKQNSILTALLSLQELQQNCKLRQVGNVVQAESLWAQQTAVYFMSMKLHPIAGVRGIYPVREQFQQ